MQFALGYIAGVATSIFIAVILVYFRKPIVSALSATELKIASVAPGSKGFIFEPRSDAETVREARIKENAEQGKDTPIAELL